MGSSVEQGPLAGVRVIDATTGIAGPLATMLLADLGAQVIRLANDLAGGAPELPGVVMWNRNKTIIPLIALADLASTADVIVTTDDSDSQSDAIDVESIADVHPGLIRVRVPGWRPPSPGASPLDPMTADRMMQADFGIARRQSSFSGGPVESVYPFTTYMQGIWAATSTIAALIERVRTGRGQTVTVDTLHGAIVAATTTMFADPLVSLPSTNVGAGGPNPAFGTYQCADGSWIFLGALGVKFQDIAFELLKTTAILENPAIASNREKIYSVELRDWARARIADGFRAKPREEWLALFETAGCPASPVDSRDVWLEHPQVEALAQRIDLADPLVGPAVVGGLPVRFSSYPDPVVSARVFRPTASWNDVRAEAALPTSDAGQLPGRGPLHGIRVLDLGTVLAGPYAGQLLASLGADVIKIETPKGDEFRIRGHMVHRGQRGLALDLRDARGYETFRALAAHSAVVLDNFRPGVVGRLRVDRESLREVQPNIISVSITGYGGIGPMGTQPGYDPVIQALTGIMTAMGGDAQPMYSTIAVNDVTVAALAAYGACAALYQQATGRGGQTVSTSLVESSTLMQNGELVRFAGRQAAEIGGRDYPGPGALSRYYASSDGWVRVHLPDGISAVEAGVIVTVPTTDEELADQLSSRFATLTADEIASILKPHGGIVARARDNKDLLFDPVTQADGHIGKVVWPDGNESYQPREYAAFSRHPENPMMTASGLGQYSREILDDVGVDETTVDELIRAGVVVQGVEIVTVAGTGYR